MNRYIATIFAVCISVEGLAQSAPASLCNANEQTYFNCLAKNGRTISICGSTNLVKDGAYLQYRYGRLNQTPELMFPANPKSPRGVFAFSNAGMGAKASVRNLKFHTGEYTYVVFRYTAVFDPETAGVEVFQRGEKAARIECKPNVYSQKKGVPNVYYVNEAHFHEIQNVGLPEVAQDELVF